MTPAEPTSSTSTSPTKKSASKLDDFSPTTAVRETCHRWMSTSTTDTESNKTTKPAFINHEALDALANEFASSLASRESLEAAEWDADGWHYSGKSYALSRQRVRRVRRVGDGSDDAQGGVRDDDAVELARMERVALYVLTLDAINFCFWPVLTKESSKKKKKNGLEYEHLAVALRIAAEADDDDVDGTDAEQNGEDTGEDNGAITCEASYALSPAKLSELNPAQLRSMIEPHLPAHSSSDDVVYELTDVEVRCRLLNELGSKLLECHDGSALTMIDRAERSADALVGIVLDTFSGFRDYVRLDNCGTSATGAGDIMGWEEVKRSSNSTTAVFFFKRAQIAVADLWAALGRSRREGHNHYGTKNICQFTDIDKLTTFPDYRVPQLLRHVGVLCYDSVLSTKINDEVELLLGGMDEISIRAGTVVAVDLLVDGIREKLEELAVNAVADDDAARAGRLRNLAKDVSAVTIDWHLWQRGEELDQKGEMMPHHRVRTTFY